MGKNCPRPMCMPNLKIVALPVCKILRGSQNFEIGACAPGDDQFRANLWSGGNVAYVHAKFEDRSFTRLQNIEGVPKFRNWVTYPRPRQLRGQFVMRGQELPTAYVHAKFEDHSFFRLRNTEGVPKFRNWVTHPHTPGDAHLGANLWSRGKNCPRPMCVPNLKGVALSVCKILAHFTALR